MNQVTIYKAQVLNTRAAKGPEPGSGSDRLGLRPNNFFGAFGGQGNFPISMDFIPADGKGNIFDFKGAGDHPPQWLGLSTATMQRKAYMYCSPLSTVIDRLAEADTNGILSFVNAEDSSLKENWRKNPRLQRIMGLMKKPNPIQTWEEFNAQQVVICKLHGYCPVLPICPFGMDKSYTKSLWNCSPEFLRPIRNDAFDPFDPENQNPILKWVGSLHGRNFEIDAEDILVIKDGFISNLDINVDLPMSKVQGLDFHISNIIATMEADNVLLKKKGPLGVFSYDAKPDMAGLQPMKNEDKLELQADLRKYGLSWNQFQYIISKVPMKWNPMSFNVQELMTKETYRQGVDGICDRFSYPAELMSGKNATYENRSSAEKYLYQNNIVSFSLRRMARYNEFFELDEVVLNLSYDHVAVMQDDILKAGQAQNYLSTSLDTDWKAGIITYDEYRVARSYKKVGGDVGSLTYPDYLIKFPNMASLPKSTKKKSNAPTS